MGSSMVKISRSAVMSGAAALLAASVTAGPALADVFNFNDSTSAYWTSASTWSKTGDSSRAYPNSPEDDVELQDLTNNGWLYVRLNGTDVTAGSIMSQTRYYWGRFYVTSESNTTVTLEDADSDEATINVRCGTLFFGGSSALTTIHLNDDLLIDNQAASTRGSVVFDAGDGSSTGARLTGTDRTITVRSVADQSLTVQTGSVLTDFTGGWVVDGSRAVLRTVQGNGLGSADNSVTLMNGGTLLMITGDATPMPGLVQTIRGSGTVDAVSDTSSNAARAVLIAAGGSLSPGDDENAIGTLMLEGDGLTVAAGASLAIDLADAGVSDQIIVTGAVALGGALDLTGLYAEAAADGWVVLTSTDMITGGFESVTDGFTWAVEDQAGSGQQLVVSVIPEPGAMSVVVGLVLLLAMRRARSTDLAGHGH